MRSSCMLSFEIRQMVSKNLNQDFFFFFRDDTFVLTAILEYLGLLLMPLGQGIATLEKRRRPCIGPDARWPG